MKINLEDWWYPPNGLRRYSMRANREERRRGRRRYHIFIPRIGEKERSERVNWKEGGF